MAALERACFTLPWSAAQCAGALAQKSFAAFGLWRGNELVGYISFYHVAGELDIVNLGVNFPERRRGLGARLLALALQAARKMGMHKAGLEVRESNVAAIALYEKNGFRKSGVRSRYYPDTGENALVYTRVL